jgi:hypothetical protein
VHGHSPASIRTRSELCQNLEAELRGHVRPHDHAREQVLEPEAIHVVGLARLAADEGELSNEKHVDGPADVGSERIVELSKHASDPAEEHDAQRHRVKYAAGLHTRCASSQGSDSLSLYMYTHTNTRTHTARTGRNGGLCVRTSAYASVAMSVYMGDLPELHIHVVHGDKGSKERDDETLHALADFRQFDGDLVALACDGVHADGEDIGLEAL